jgi:hypothetical protein
VSDTDSGAAEFKARAIEANRPAYELWKDTCTLVEDRIETPRTLRDPVNFAYDLLFIQIYKSMSSVYYLAVRGQEEDAFTILRRLLELGAQLEYLHRTPPGEIEARAKQFLHQDPDVGPHYWWGGSLATLFKDLGLQTTWENDYRFLAQIGHGVARRNLLHIQDGQVHIRSTEHFTSLLLFAVLYTLGAARAWNSRFHLLSEDAVEALVTRSMEFRTKRLERAEQRERGPQPAATS